MKKVIVPEHIIERGGAIHVYLCDVEGIMPKSSICGGGSCGTKESTYLVRAHKTLTNLRELKLNKEYEV